MSQKPVAAVSGRFARTPQIVQSAFFGVWFTTASFLTGLGTLYALSDVQDRLAQAYPILLFNLALVVCLGAYLGFRIWNILFSKKNLRSAPLLHRRFVLFFSLAALIPAILVGSFSTSLISRNINNVYGEDVSLILDNSYEFLNKYVAGELGSLRQKVVEIQRFLEINQGAFENRITYTYGLQRFSVGLNVDAVYVMNREGIIFSSFRGVQADFRIPAPFVFDQLEKAGRIGVQTQDEKDYLIGLTKLRGYDDVYIMVGQYLQSDAGVLSSLSGIQDTKDALIRQRGELGNMRKIFLLTFIETVLLIVIAAIWLGILLANTIIEPLGRIIYAAELVRSGDMSARVSVKRDWGEMSDLGSAFNRMTRQLSTQREDLVREHDISEQRRQFSEAVLSGVTAGVMGLTQDGRITLMNASAERLTGHKSTHILGHPLDTVFPEFAAAFKTGRENIASRAEHQVTMETSAGTRNFDMRISAYEGTRQDTGWVLTFDDMTRLVTAQRHSAWREVARRIAHEIKNPLTPIQLSTERLKRKYSGKITTDPDVFDSCTDTILRQVASLEQMVNEFSSFARMPAPDFAQTNAKDLMERILFEQRVAFPAVKFDLQTAFRGQLSVLCDERLIGQALTNLYKNASESIAARVDDAGIDEPDGRIVTRLSREKQQLIIAISDNGRGWPFPDIERVMEPYVTTRSEGTGLGLAIVRRIAEDHQGQLQLSKRPDGERGAHVEFRLPIASFKSAIKTKKKTTDNAGKPI
ncbi:MAG: ATP-binding protein [Alphaproteobacteria bacterium]